MAAVFFAGFLFRGCFVTEDKHRPIDVKAPVARTAADMDMFDASADTSAKAGQMSYMFYGFNTGRDNADCRSASDR